MNIQEAIKRSRLSGGKASYSRGGGWIKFQEGWTYKLSASDLESDNWRPCGDNSHIYDRQYETEQKKNRRESC